MKTSLYNVARQGMPALFSILFLLCGQPAAQGQPDSIRALRFARQPDAGAPDSLRLYAAYFQKKDDLRNWLSMHLQAGKNLIFDEKNHTDGIRILEKALQPFRPPKNAREWEMWGSLHVNAAYVHYRVTENLERARAYYETARAIYQDTLRISGVFVAEQVINELGNIHALFRDYEKASYFLHQAKDICIQHKAYGKAANAINDLAVMLRTRGDWNGASRYYREALALPGLAVENVLQLSINLAEALARTGHPDDARHVSTECQRILEEKQDSFSASMRFEFWADLHENLALVARQKKQWETAALHYRCCGAFYEQKFGGPNNRIVAQCRLKSSDLYLECDRPDSALYYAQAALRCLLPDIPLTDDLSNPAFDALKLENTLSSALRNKIRALRLLCRETPNNPRLLNSCLETCDLLFGAEESLRRLYDFDGSKLFRQDIVREYYDIALWVVQQLKTIAPDDHTLDEQAFQYAEQARERLLAEALQEHEALAGIEMPGAIRRQLDALQAERAQLEIQRYQATAGYDTLDALLFEKHLAWKNLVRPYLNNVPKGLARPPITDLSRLRGTLKPDQALLEYFVSDSNLYVVALTKNTLRLIPLQRAGDLENTVESLLKTLTGSGDTVQFSSRATLLFTRSASQLYKWLLVKPLAELPKSVNKLIIVPDGILCYLPFEALGVPGAQNSGAFRSFPFLIRDYTVAYAYSGKSLLAQNNLAAASTAAARATFIGFSPQYGSASGSGRRNFTFGAPLFRDSLPNLPGAVREVTDIARLLDGKVYIDSAATEAQFKSRAGQFRILHFAMHALLDDQDPRFSKLLFTKGRDGKEDDDLYAVELYGMQLTAEMAVLSACQTGVGALRRGEGLMSLSKAFSIAGAPATVMSLWSVDDTETATLMIDFYQSLAMGLPKDEALRQAKLQYLTTAPNTRASPYFWAGFIAAGDMTPLFPR